MLIVGAAVIVMLRSFIPVPAEFVALTVKLNVPIVIGVPVIVPDDAFRLKPAGSVPTEIDHVIGVVPVALSD